MRTYNWKIRSLLKRVERNPDITYILEGRFLKVDDLGLFRMLTDTRIYSVLLVILALTLRTSEGSLCPPPENISPCTCSANTDTCFYSCKGNEPLQGLHDFFLSCPNVEFNIYGGDIDFLENGFFGRFGEVKSFRLSLSGLNIQSLGAQEVNSSPFQGLGVTDRFSLQMLLVTPGTSWTWTPFSAVKFGSHVTTNVHSNTTLLKVLDEEFYRAFSNSNMASLDMSGTSHTKPLVLADVPKGTYSMLKYIAFRENAIVTINRSNLPHPATNLEFLDLSYNRINNLPEDLFTEMPQLKTLSLAFNPTITVLHETLFKPVLERINWLDITATNPTCDCQLAWIIPYINKVGIGGGKVRPLLCFGKPLFHLTVEDFNC
ncbi:uncharacterized protein LOC143256235 isoform X2 [Tachypleus tridentatus]|uniref:uncharacterized protein LOC143256235 isoform X2 n=1 Tax=Tachypleus tridentatus TaxID=6853 RepID=UPI003FD32C54